MSAALSPDGKPIVTASADWTARVWSVLAREEWEPRLWRATSACLSVAGRQRMLGEDGQTVRKDYDRSRKAVVDYQNPDAKAP
ncbi:MAG: WD40 domain-containing protein [Proteobacteria bacterium]|nr:WD40 domain-containing protein [Pseudomonadota bacterium]